MSETAEHKVMLRKVAIASIIGATIEWYDFFLYGVVAGIVFNKLYFPTGDPFISTLLAYSTFAVGFLTRPLGGVIFGHFGDKLGRKSMLVLTLMIMGGSTVLIGLVPAYATIGIAAPILLLLLRIVQGIGLGGEWGGAVLMTFEYAPKKERGYYASLPQIGLSLGLCLASGVVGLLSFFLTEDQFFNWGWRIAFLLSVVMLAVGSYIRLNVKETPEFAKLKEANKAKTKNAPIHIADMWKNFKGSTIAGMGARYIDGVFFNIFGVFSITYLTNYANVSRTEALMGVMIAAFTMCFTIPYFGWLSDKIGRTKLYFWGSLAAGLCAFPAFWVFDNFNNSVPLVWLAIVIPFSLCYASVYGPEAALFSDLYPARVRYTGISFVYQFSGIFASGMTPLIATALLKMNDNNPLYVSLYLLFAGVISMISARWIGKNKDRIEAAAEEREYVAPVEEDVEDAGASQGSISVA